MNTESPANTMSPVNTMPPVNTMSPAGRRRCGSWSFRAAIDTPGAGP